VSYPSSLWDERAKQLARQLDRRYLALTGGLPPLLRSVARQASTYTGIAGDEPFAGISSLNPGLTGAPWLFGRLFARLDVDALLDLAEAGALVVLAAMILDHLVDGQLEQRETLTLLQSTLQHAGTARLHRLFPTGASFWLHFQRLGKEHVAGLAAEVELSRSP
jgi:hypothetical protein